jgi:hypothetical protein
MFESMAPVSAVSVLLVIAPRTPVSRIAETSTV